MKHKRMIILAAILLPLCLLQGFAQAPQSSQVPHAPTPQTTILAPVEIGETWGFIDKSDKMVIPAKFDDAESFSEGLALVSSDYKYGYIDKTGSFVIPAQYKLAKSFSEDVASVTGGQFTLSCYIDKSGKPFFGAEIAAGNPFSDGLAAVQFTGENGPSGYIDKAGKMLIQRKFNSMVTAYPFSEGLAAVYDAEKIRWGFVDKTGAIFLAQIFLGAGKFSDGLAPVAVNVTIGVRWGFIDKSGKMVIQPRYADAESFSEGLAAVQAADKWGYIDKTGAMVIPPQFTTADPFSEGLARVKIGLGREGKNGYVDKTGKMVIPAHYDAALKFSVAD